MELRGANMTRSAYIALTSTALFLLSGCQSAQLGLDKPIAVHGRYNVIGECILDDLRSNGISNALINYKDLASSQIVDIEVPLYGMFGPQDTVIAFKIKQLSQDIVDVRMTAFSSIGDTHVNRARHAFAQCTTPIGASP